MTPEQAAELLVTIKGIEAGLGSLSLWVFLLLMFKNMSHK